MDPTLAHEVGAVLGSVVSTVLDSEGNQETRIRSRYVLHVAPAPDPTITHSWFVYALAVEHSEPSHVLVVSPRLFLSGQAATTYAEHLVQTETGLTENPLLLLTNPADLEPDVFAWQAWDQWVKERHLRADPLSTPIPFGPYVLGDIPGAGILLWRPVLTAAGTRIGLLTPEDDVSLTGTPILFPSERLAKQALHDRRLPPPIPDLLYTPMSLLNEIDCTGDLHRIRPAPALWPGDPVQVTPSAKSPQPNVVPISPGVYVSADKNGHAFAWQEAGLDTVQFLRTNYAKGPGTARWQNVGRALQDLSLLGILAQEHPSLVITPDQIVRPTVGMHI